MPVITLTTDFGSTDHFVGVMKGVILSVNPTVRIVDISHQVPPQDIVAAAFLIPDFFPYFPEGSIHVVVVDPGVGTERTVLAIQASGHFFVGPDNGLFTKLIETHPVKSIVGVNNQEYFLKNVSRTFHGRDIFAPVAAHISNGVPISSMGSELDEKKVVRIDIPRASIDAAGKLTGSVISIDRFGNLVTNISKEMLETFVDEDGAGLVIHVGSASIEKLSGRYRDVEAKRPLAIIGSRGVLEISLNQGSAADDLRVCKGDPVSVNRR